MTKEIRLSLITIASLLAAASFSTKAQAQTPAGRPATGKGTGDKALIERGRYIVEGVAMCERCHTQRDERGKADRGRWLMGGPIQWEVTYPEPKWAQREPRIAGTPPGTDAEFIRLLTTGISRTGQPPNPPMPPFRMTREDAEAVLAYLKSL